MILYIYIYIYFFFFFFFLARGTGRYRKARASEQKGIICYKKRSWFCPSYTTKSQKQKCCWATSLLSSWFGGIY